MNDCKTCQVLECVHQVLECVKHTTNDQIMLNMHNHGNPQKRVLNGVQNNEKIPYRHFMKHLECTHYTNI